MLTFGSVCSGVEAASVAWEQLGWQAQWFSEIEAFPSAVLAHRFPSVPNLGDMTKLHTRSEFNDRPIDLLVGGTPCQSFSVAGLRKGMADPRGNLALTYLALADRKRPRWLVWENVPGVLSSGGGRDFGAFLGGLGQLGYGFAYRVLDAQYFGVAQRRRRVFVIGHLGDWRPAAAVLFEPHSMQGHPAPSREAGTAVTRTSTYGSYTYRWQNADDGLVPDNISATLKAKGTTTDERSVAAYVAHTLRAEGFDASEDGTGRGIPLVAARMTAFGLYEVDGTASTVKARDYKDATDLVASAANDNYAVRRLTPREFERLQGFPDDWTLVPYRGKPAADGPRYKAMGNSMAVPVMRWIGYRIKQFEQGEL